MLYNEKWSEPKRDIHSLESLIAWLENKPADQSYDYCNNERCLLSQYYSDMGLKNVSVGSYYISSGGGLFGTYGQKPISRRFHDIAIGDCRKWTFGEALERAKKHRKVSVAA